MASGDDKARLARVMILAERVAALGREIGLPYVAASADISSPEPMLGADGKPLNHPGNLAGVCEGLAEILGLSPGALAGLTDANARALFG